MGLAPPHGSERFSAAVPPSFLPIFFILSLLRPCHNLLNPNTQGESLSFGSLFILISSCIWYRISASENESSRLVGISSSPLTLVFLVAISDHILCWEIVGLSLNLLPSSNLFGFSMVFLPNIWDPDPRRDFWVPKSTQELRGLGICLGGKGNAVVIKMRIVRKHFGALCTS